MEKEDEDAEEGKLLLSDDAKDKWDERKKQGQVGQYVRRVRMRNRPTNGRTEPLIDVRWRT